MNGFLHKILRILNDSTLGFLALLAAELALAPSVFEMSVSVSQILDAVQWAIIAAFALEYIVALALARKKSEFILNPWRILDLIIVAAPLLSLLPQVSNALRSTPVLRLLRLLRLVSFAARAGGAVVRDRIRRQASTSHEKPEVTLFKPDGFRLQRGEWEDFTSWMANPNGDWCHLSNITSAQFDTLARMEGLSRPLLESCLGDANYPRLEIKPGGWVLSLWLPSMRGGPTLAIERATVLLVVKSDSVLTVAPRICELPAVLSSRLNNEMLSSTPLATRLPLILLKLAAERNEDVAGHLEQQLRALEDVPVRDSRPEFFELVFRLRKELTAAKSDLWRVKGILTALAEARVRLPGIGTVEQEFLRVLADQVGYLYDTVDNLREGLLSVMELHMNVVSFEMNKFMRLLAVVSVLGLIPAVVGGMLGMNLTGNPWPPTLTQVSYGVGSSILLCLYIFLVRGWLR